MENVMDDMSVEQRKVYTNDRISKAKQGICPDCGSSLGAITGTEYHKAAAGDTSSKYLGCTECQFKCMN